MKAVYIEWVDSCAPEYSGWRSLDTLMAYHAEPSICRSIGYEVHDGKDAIIVAGHYSGNNNIEGTMTIPKRAIIKRRIIKLPK